MQISRYKCILPWLGWIIHFWLVCSVFVVQIFRSRGQSWKLEGFVWEREICPKICVLHEVTPRKSPMHFEFSKAGCNSFTATFSLSKLKLHLQKHEVCSATVWTPPIESTHRELPFEWSHLQVSFARKWTLFSNNTNSTIRKYSRAFIWVVTPLGFVGQFRLFKFSWFSQICFWQWKG